jgi:hypothetical protein
MHHRRCSFAVALLAATALLALRATALSALPRVDEEDPPDCENTCTADPVTFGGGPAWDVQIAPPQDGSADWEDCQQCTPCTVGIILTYLGSGTPGFGGSNVDFQVNGNICTGEVTTDCDAEDLGSLRGQSPQGSVRVDLYCTCVAH